MITKEIEGKIEAGLVFPSFPAVVIDLLNYLSTEKAHAEGIENIVKRDPSLAAEILRIANSPLYGMGRIGSIKQALTFLGLETVKYIAISAAVSTVFKTSALEKGAGLDFTNFWFHSIRIATIARLLAQRIGYQEPEAAFVAGLLHDLGRLALAQLFPEDYKKMMEKAKEEEPTSYEELEREIFGITHTEIGKKIFQFWNLPHFLAEVAERHHLPLSKVSQLHVQIVSVAHLVDGILKLSPNHRPFALDSLSNLVSGLWHLTEDDLKEVLTIAEDETVIAANSIGIPVPKEKEEIKKGEITRQTEFLAKFFVFWNILKGAQVEAIEEIGENSAKAFDLAFRVKRFIFLLKDKDESGKEILKPIFPKEIEDLETYYILIEKKDDPIIEAIEQKRIIFVDNSSKFSCEGIKEYFEDGLIVMPFFYNRDKYGVILVEKIPLDKRVLNLIAEQIGTKIKVFSLLDEKSEWERERKQLRQAIKRNIERLVELEKRAAMLEAIAATVHEVNQSLMVIQGTTELLLDDLSQSGKLDASTEERLSKILEATKRINEFLKNITVIKGYKTKKYWRNIKILDI